MVLMKRYQGAMGRLDATRDLPVLPMHSGVRDRISRGYQGKLGGLLLRHSEATVVVRLRQCAWRTMAWSQGGDGRGTGVRVVVMVAGRTRGRIG